MGGAGSDWPELADVEQLVRLDGESPLRVLEAVGQGGGRVSGCVGAVHWLEQEILEVEPSETLRPGQLLREDQLELVALCQRQFGVRLGADAYPIEAPRSGLRAVGLDRNLKSFAVQSLDRGFVELQQWLTARADHEWADGTRRIVRRPVLTHKRGERLGRGELTAVRANPYKIRIAERAHCVTAIGLATRPQIAPGETQKDRWSPRVGSFALQRVKTLFDRVRQL